MSVRIRSAPLVGGLLGVLALSALACEYPGVPHPQAAKAAAKPAATETADSTPAAPATTDPMPQPGAAQPGASIALKDFRLDPDTVTVKAGDVTFTLTNQGNYVHDFRVEGSGVDDRAPKVGSGRSSKWTIALTPGAYRISCPISNHADRGMNGTLTVVE